MEWWVLLVLLFGSLFLLMTTGIPVAFSFAIVNLLGMFFLFGGKNALPQLILSMSSSVTTFVLLPVPLFILMGEVLWHSGIGVKAIEVLDKWLGRLPGRLSLLSVLAGVIFAAVSGSNMANTALLGSALGPEMEKRGYQKPMVLGPIMGSGALAMMIPPSALGVLCAAIGRISVGKLLIAIIIPGVILAALYIFYIVGRCSLQPSLAPSYQLDDQSSLSDRIRDTLLYLLPLAIIIFLTVALIFIGISTPSEAAAIGCLASCILGIIVGGVKWLPKAIKSSLRVAVMAFIIMSQAAAYSQILAYSGASRGLIEFVASLQIPPILIIICMQIALIILGGPMEEITIMMIGLPILMPIVQALGYDPVWFGVLILINVEIALLSPPFGMVLFVMKGVSTKDTTIGDVFRSALPFMVLQMIAMAIIIAFPLTALWLPGLMQ